MKSINGYTRFLPRHFQFTHQPPYNDYQQQRKDQLEYKGLILNITQKKVSIDGTEVALTKKEFEILMLLLQNQGRVFSREDILAKVWQEEVYVLDRTIDVNITRLRKKIGEYGKRIVTRLGYGYCFECE